MTTIYKILNSTTNVIDFVCDSQETIDAGKAAGIPGNFIIGDESVANALLNTNKQTWLASQKDQFVVQKSIISNENDHTWELCDLENEPDNTDVQYNHFCFPNGYWEVTIGLQASKEFDTQLKNTAASFFGFDAYDTLTKCPEKPKARTEGTQTL